MLRNSIPLLGLTVLLFACKQDAPPVVNATPVGERVVVKVEDGTKSDELKANAVAEGDMKGLATKALQPLQAAYKAASGKVPGVGEVTVKVDDNLNLIIENKDGSTTTTSQVNLKSIDTDVSHIEIIPNTNGKEFPGFRIKTLAGQPKIAILKNGSKEKDMDYLEVILAERTDVHKCISAITLAAQAAQSSLPAEK